LFAEKDKDWLLACGTGATWAAGLVVADMECRAAADDALSRGTGAAVGMEPGGP